MWRERHAVPLPESIWAWRHWTPNADGKLDDRDGRDKGLALPAPDWRPQVLLFDSREPKMLYCVALDADGDGDLDIAVGRYRALD